MASEERKTLENWLKPLLKDFGFNKKGPTWHRDSSLAIQVLNIQGSQWSKSFYINLGVFYKEFGEKEKPNEYECHVRERLCALVDDLENCNCLLDFENTLLAEDRKNQLTNLISLSAISWLGKCSSPEGAKEYLLNLQRRSLQISEETRSYLQM